MIQTIKPDFELKIGIKDSKINNINWTEYAIFNPKYKRKDIIKFLEAALIEFKKSPKW